MDAVAQLMFEVTWSLPETDSVSLRQKEPQATPSPHRQGYFTHFIPPPGAAQMGSVTVGAGAAAGVFERESDLLSESRSAMATQVHCSRLAVHV